MSDPFAVQPSGNLPKTAMAGRKVMSGYERGLLQAGFSEFGNEKLGDYIWTPGVRSMSTSATSGGRPWGGGGGGGSVAIPRMGAVSSGGVRANWNTLNRNSQRVGNAVYKMGRGFQKLNAASQMNTLNTLVKQRNNLQQMLANPQQPAAQPAGPISPLGGNNPDPYFASRPVLPIPNPTQ